ncbi:Inositol-pentakisphosphate 2-kinase [Cadophora gregata]|uniref:Inositol-pentakisphosphate 2-kinase n=1 Tax=Cadophora gregata TaxID=51156 RepID=UPI0026DCBBBE|nr:Inositol-pentakisphosphate 2-kinase [Cadophora gregata]KAK0101254.1 Inositol-pentakisphosphate 2-kinase [Cadophora gregata]
MSEPNIPILPENAELQYLGEGAANIVYRISIPQPQPSTPPPTELDEYGEGTPPPSEIEFNQNRRDLGVFETPTDKLLRLRKDLPTTFPCLHAQSTWTRLISPLFQPSQLVSQSLVSLHPGSYNHITTLNDSLLAWENGLSSTPPTAISTSSRPPKRHGTYLANDPHGLLVTDMSGSGVVQFKPKWLAQSPSAPRGARRCRQCALVARKAFLSLSSSSSKSQKVNPGEEETPATSALTFCPLDLLSTDKEIIRKVAECIILSQNTAATTTNSNTHTNSNASQEKEILALTDWISTTSSLKRLRDVQLAMDKHGILAAEAPASEELRVAMTVRDCSVFVRLNLEGDLTIGSGESQKRVGEGGGDGLGGNGKREEEELEARIGDLDVKSPEKLGYWKETERVLVEEGWYAGRVEEGWSNTCLLGREL